MATCLTISEKFVAWLCQNAFLKLWTHPNPIGKNNKELCDCLIVCGKHLIIISVKEIEYRDTGNKTGWERWHKAAIEKSAKQIWGAERWLQSADSFKRADGREVTLPPNGTRNYHRISVSLGGRGEVPLRWGDFGNGFIHVLDEYSLTEFFRELNTISDFVSYLSAVEALFETGVRPMFAGGGAEDLLALYVIHGPTFGLVREDGAVPDRVIITEGLWKNLTVSSEYIERNKELQPSFAWDRLIEHYTKDLLTDGMFDMHSKQVTKNELSLVEMALQPRGHRANLADSFLEFLSPKGAKIASRVVLAANSTAFVFLGGESSDREFRSKELWLRCLVVRGKCPNVTTVIGIATDKPQEGKTGHSSDILYLYIPIWTEKDAKQVEGVQRDLGYFKNTNWLNLTPKHIGGNKSHPTLH